LIRITASMPRRTSSLSSALSLSTSFVGALERHGDAKLTDLLQTLADP
jgi:hypothetical protein